MRLSQHGGRSGVGQHEGQPLRGILGVERQVGGARFQRPQQGDHQLERPLHADAHHGLRAHSRSPQPVSQLVRARLQLGIGQLFRAALHCHRIGCSGYLRLDQLVQAGFGHRRCGGVPIVEQQLPFDAVQPGQPR